MIYSIITEAGRAETCDPRKTYWDILRSIHETFMSAGSQWDRPNMLIRDGEVVVASKLADVAYAYGESRANGMLAAEKLAQSEHILAWL